MKKLILIAVFAIFSVSNAMSASLSDLSPSIGLSGNWGAYAGEGTERNFDESGALRTVTEEYGAFAEYYPSIFVEVAVGDILSVGLDYVPTDIESPTNHSREGTGSSAAGNALNPGNSRVSVDFGDLTTVYAKLNLTFLGGTYIKAGYSTVDVKINETMSSGNTYADKDTEGYTAGIGYAHSLDNGVSIRAEITASQFEDVTTNNGVATTGNHNAVEVDNIIGARGTISIVKTF